MEMVFPGKVAADMLLPLVADELCLLSEEFGCDLRWTRDSPETPGTFEELRAAPLIPSYADPYGIRTSLATDVDHGESKWRKFMRGASRERGKQEGYVTFRAGMDVRFSLVKGLDLFDSSEDNRKRFLCWADEFELSDGTTCFRINHGPGFLWIRGADQSGIGTRMLHQGINGEYGEPTPKGHAVVELQEYDFGYEVNGPPYYKQTPWDGMKCEGADGRPWHIVQGSLRFHCMLRLNVVGRYNDRLKTKPRKVPEWPYRTIWERWMGDDEKQIIPLDYY